MKRRETISCVIALSASACMQTNTEVLAVPPVVREALVSGAEPASPVAIDLAIEDGVAHGRLSWASSCRRVVLVRERSQEVIRTKPVYGAAAAAGITGLLAGVGGVVLLDSSDGYSNEVTCEENCAGICECSSPRGEVTGHGLFLLGSAIALTTAAVVTAASRSSSMFRDIESEPARQARVLAEGVPCGEGPVAWLELALYRGDERIAASTTNDDGDVAFSVPVWFTGPVRLVADSAFLRYGIITPGQELGEIVLEPTANPSAQ